MTQKELQKAYREVISNQAILLDVRTQQERQEYGFEPKSLHMDYELFTEGKLPKLEKDTTIYIHCKSGGRAGVIAHVLQAKGFKKAYNLGGYKDWLELTK